MGKDVFKAQYIQWKQEEYRKLEASQKYKKRTNEGHCLTYNTLKMEEIL